jgi:hypothetical protein
MREKYRKGSMVGVVRGGTLALLCLGLVACGGGGNNGGGGGGGGTVTQPPVPTRQRIANGTFNLPPGAVFIQEFIVNRTGTADARVNWTSPGNDVDIALVRGRCLTGTCGQLLAADVTLGKPAVVQQSNLAPGDYSLLIENLGPGGEAGSYELFFTS